MFSVFLYRMVAHTNIRKYLDREHPHLFTEKYGCLYLAAAALFVALSINHQQPHGLQHWHHPHKWSILSCFGLIPLAVFVLVYELLPRLFPQHFAKHRWTRANELSSQVIFFVTAASLNWGFAIAEIPYFRASTGSFFHFQLYSLEYGYPPICSISLLVSIRHSIRTGKYRSFYPVAAQPQTTHPTPIALPFSYNKLQLDLNKVLYISKYVNNLQFHVLHDNGCEVLECNGTIKDLMQHVRDYPQLIQTHQTFVVNILRVKRLKGNSNAMEITFVNCPDKVQVSRSYVERVKNALTTR